MNHVKSASIFIVGLTALLTFGCPSGGDAPPAEEPSKPSTSSTDPPDAVPSPPPTDDIIFDPTNAVLWSYGTQNVTPDAALNGTGDLPSVSFLPVDPKTQMQIQWASGASPTDISSFTVYLTGGTVTVTRGASTYAWTVPGGAKQEPGPPSLGWPQNLTTFSNTTIGYTPVGGTATTTATTDVDQITVPFADTP